MADHSGKTLARGADGNLYSLSMTDPPELVPDDLAQEFLGLLPGIQQALEALFTQEISQAAASCHQTIKIVIPDVDLP